MRKFNADQARVPAGGPGGGQWAGGGSGGEAEPTSFARVPMIAELHLSQALESALAVYNHLTQAVGPMQQAILGFGARLSTGAVEIGRAATGELDYQHLGALPLSSVGNVCPRLPVVQTILDDTVARIGIQNPGLSPSQFGTAVHLDIERQINGLKDPTFVAERSLLKGREADYGTRGSIRIDVLETTVPGTVCVYDIKTGRSGLTRDRVKELAGEAFAAFLAPPAAIIVTEVRPKR